MSDRQTAVALRYVQKKEDSPRVVAKGHGSLAERIMQIAAENGIPVRQDSDLVEILVRLDIGEMIPPELYQAVAEVLAFVYQMNKDVD